MQTNFYTQDAARIRTDVLVLALHKGWKSKDPTIAFLDLRRGGLNGNLATLLKSEKFNGGTKQSVVL